MGMAVWVSVEGGRVWGGGGGEGEKRVMGEGGREGRVGGGGGSGEGREEGGWVGGREGRWLESEKGVGRGREGGGEREDASRGKGRGLEIGGGSVKLQYYPVKALYNA